MSGLLDEFAADVARHVEDMVARARARGDELWHDDRRTVSFLHRIRGILEDENATVPARLLRIDNMLTRFDRGDVPPDTILKFEPRVQ